MIRILLAEDSPVQRQLLAALLEAAGGFSLVGAARDGAEAVEMTCRLRPDIVLMDCHMPRMDGIEATRAIMEACPTPIVVTSASLPPEELGTGFNAIRHGALAVVAKPVAPDAPGHAALVEQLVRTLLLMAEVRVVRRWPKPAEAAAAAKTAGPLAVPRRRLRLLAIAGSTGAPGVIADILAGLGRGLPFPVLIVQHMTAGFLEGFARWLAYRCGFPVEVGREGAVAAAGRAYVAPDGLHLGIERSGRLRLSDEPAEEGFRPSANRLFRSAAEVFGAAACGVLLTGMGRDGAAGLLAMRHAGGLTVVQAPASCVVPGMPSEAVRLDAAEQVLAPADIVRLIATLAEQKGGGDVEPGPAASV